jgi:hypothetical protein
VSIASAAGRDQLVPAGLADEHHRFEPDLGEHRPVVTAAIGDRADQQPQPGLADHVAQLMRAAGSHLDQRLAAGVPGGGAFQVLPDRLTE